jgi:hypothetical protein
MRLVVRVLALIALCGALSAINAQQKGDIRIERFRQGADRAVPGQIIDLWLSGITKVMVPTIPIDRFEVLVLQDDATHRAKVRAVTSTMATLPTTLPPSSENRAPAADEMLTQMKVYTHLSFTVPQDLHEGEAAAIVIYDGSRSDRYMFDIINRPLKPRMHPMVVAAMSLSSPRRLPVAPPGELNKPPVLEFVRGEEKRVLVFPLIDPEAPGAGVLVTFKQGSFSREVKASVTRVNPSEQHRGPSMVFAPTWYDVSIKVPDELAAGNVEIELRVQVNGQVSEPGLENATIIDASTPGANPGRLAPRIANMSPSKIGKGQAIQLAVLDSQKLVPDPSKTLVVIQQDSREIEVKPEFNSADYYLSGMLAVRFQDEFVGKVLVRVLNPAAGKPDGLSDPIELEIVDEVLPPTVSKVAESGKQDIAMLAEMRDQALKAGREFRDYDPRSRYVTIRATGLDYNPNFVRIEFRQAGRSYVLKFEDFSLTLGERLVVRLPDQIGPGTVQVTIQNRGLERLSEPVITTFEVTQPSRRR